MTAPTLSELVNAVTTAGRIINTTFGTSIAEQTKQDFTPVSAIDIAVNNDLRKWAAYRKIGYIGEEGNGTTDAEYILTVDSLDGTGAYLRGMATATVIATIMKMEGQIGTPIKAVIHNPVTKQTWRAEVGKGTYYSRYAQKPELVYVAEEQGPYKTAICSWPGVGPEFVEFNRRVIADRLRRFSDQQMGAFGIGGGLIASGLLHATAICGPTSAVETCAMSLIIREAGGVAMSLHGDRMKSFELGVHKGKIDFLLPHGAILGEAHAAVALRQLYKR